MINSNLTIKSACAHIRIAAQYLDAACKIDQEAADRINKVEGQENLERLADRLEQLIEEPVS